MSRFSWDQFYEMAKNEWNLYHYSRASPSWIIHRSCRQISMITAVRCHFCTQVLCNVPSPSLPISMQAHHYILDNPPHKICDQNDSFHLKWTAAYAAFKNWAGDYINRFCLGRSCLSTHDISTWGQSHPHFLIHIIYVFQSECWLEWNFQILPFIF